MAELSAITSSNTPKPQSLSNSDDVLEQLRSWIQLDDNSKFHEDAVKQIESVVERQLTCLETTLVERKYVKVVLEMWLNKSLRKAVDYLKDETLDISVDMSTLLSQLYFINSFEDIGLKLNEVASSQLTALCDGECQYLKLILDQVDLFKNTPRFTIIVASYFKQFKTSCIDKIFSRCLGDIAKDQVNGMRNWEFIRALNALLAHASEDVRTLNILETNLIGSDVTDFSNSNVEDLTNKLLDIYASCSNATEGELPKWLNRLKFVKKWTPKLQLLAKETCKAYLLPKIKIEVKDEYGRKIIFIKGVSVFASKMIEEMKRLKLNFPELQEIQIVGLSSVHIDCHLENDSWHGTNVGIVTEKLFVDCEVYRNEETTESNDNGNAVDNFSFCWDVSGKNGEPGQPGKNGGNVHIICNEMINAERWKIVCDGGDGGDGQNGSNGESKTKGKPSKWSKAYFNRVLPSMSTFDTGEQADGIVPEDAVKTVLTTLKDLLPVNNRNSGKDIQPDSDYQGRFSIEGTAVDGSTISVSFYQSATKRHTLILCQGSSIGQGGSGGTITFEFMTGRDTLATESNVPLVGKENRQPRAMRMGVYEAMGSDGKMGTPVGDVAFIHSLDTCKASANENLAGHYIGFENDVVLWKVYHSTKPIRQSKDRYNIYLVDNYYVKLQKGLYGSIAYRSMPAYNRVQSLHSTMVNATKKKAIVRQSLAQQFIQVDERKQMTQCLQAKLSSNWEEEQLTDNVNLLISQMEDKETQLYQLTSQCSRGLENVGSMKFLKPALKKKLNVYSVSETSRSVVGRQSVGRRPVDFRQKPPVNVRCLDVLPTTSGVDSAIHSIFGRINSDGSYFCNNVTMFRHRLATFIRQSATNPILIKEPSDACGSVTFIPKKENRVKVSSDFIKQFVLRVQKNDALEFPVANDVKVSYFKHRRTNGKENEFKWQNATELDDLFEEYAKFVENPSNPLESAEVELLADIHHMKVHVYKDQSSSFKYEKMLNPERYKERYILHHGDGEWQRVEPNIMVKNFYEKIDDDLFECQPIQTHHFRKFLDFLEKQGANFQAIDSMKMLNPENGDTPDKLFQLLLERFGRNGKKQDDWKTELMGECSNDLCLLVEWINEHNCRNLSPIFYLNIVKQNLPVDWGCEFFMLEIFDRFTQEVSDEIAIGDIRHWLYKIAVGMPSLVPLLRKLVARSDSCAALQPQNLFRLLEMIAKDCEQCDGIISHQWPEFELLPLSDWFFYLKSKMWEKKISLLHVNPSTPKENKKLKMESIYMLLELEFKKKQRYCEELLKQTEDLKAAVILLRNALYSGATPSHEYVERNIDDIITKMKENAPKNDKLVISMVYPRMLADFQKKVKDSKLMSDQVKEFNEQECKLTRKKIKKLIKQWQTNGFERNDTSIVDFLYVYDYAVQKTCTKEGDKQIFRLRDTQRVAIITLLTSKSKNTLTQVSTGEGKSLIVTGVAIAFALCRNDELTNKKVDVITSNDVLARRDSTLSVADGGLRDLYEYFNISVANNCSQWVDERTQAYNAAVVFGQLVNFQRDYLLDKFYGHNIRGDRTMDLVIIDEVDCMLLDRGNNTLYLSHDIPGMEMIESLYVFIWEKIRSSSAESDKPTIRESVKSAVLYDLYGAITKDDLESIYGPLKDQPSEKNALWDYLIETKVIDPQGRLLMEDKIENINFKPQMNSKIIFHLRSVAKRERSIRIPEHLMLFVDRHLDTWLDNALQALELKRDEDYVVDQDRTDTSPCLNPQVIIIDQDTGMDQTSSQWDGALHQFIQLNEGCKLTSQMLKAVFVSNATYVQAYERAAGVSGTLGSETERLFMQTKYKSIQLVIPTAFHKRFYLKPTQVFKSMDHWLHAIAKETRDLIHPDDQVKARSLVIFCKSIKDVHTVHHYLKNALKSELDGNHIHCYTRDYEKFVFEGKSLEVGHVIIATNLAGRGTDIKISQKLQDNGGLHVCLTFLPKNERIEEQAMGRSARNGAPGSGIFLLCEESSMGKKWGVGKWFSMKEERQWKESQRISRLQEDFRTMEKEQNVFDELSIYYTDLKQELKNEKREVQEIKTICDSVLDKWALWLDQTEDHLRLPYSSYSDVFKDFSAGLGLPDSNTIDTRWMTPVRSVTMAKHLAMQKSCLVTAGEILSRVIDSKDCYFYPAAYYYLAFILFQEDFEDNKTKFIQLLQTCENILNDHIDVHLSFYRKVVHMAPDRAPTFCVVDAYKQQKYNTVSILEYFVGSIRALLGNHYCSASNLEEAGREAPEKLHFETKILKKAQTFLQESASFFSPFQKKRKPMGELKRHKICPEKADKLFQSLVKQNCITCQLNNTDAIPNRNAIIQQVSNEFGIEKLLENLESAFGENLNEEQIEKKLKKENLISCTRKAFWEELKREGALEAVKGGLCSQMKCVIMLESECDGKLVKLKDEKVNRDDFQFGMNSFDRKHNCLNVLYNPIYANMEDLLKQKKVMFSKRDVVEQLGDEEYRHRKGKFEFNKIAQLNLNTLEKVRVKFAGPLEKADLGRANIISNGERDGVWEALIAQQIIDSNGKLSSNYQKFSYSQCPAYEEPVMRVIGRTFAAEIVKRQWLKATQEPNCLKAIILLPLKPYRDMLGELMAAHVISGARVTEDAKLIEEKTKEIEEEDERECVRKFLKSREAVHVPRRKKYDIFLDLIEMDIRKIPNTKNISTELYIFDLIGFNHVIDIKDRESSWKTYLAAALVGAGAVASISGGFFLIHHKLLSFGLSKNLLLMGGISDILYAVTTILTCSNFTWADYIRQRLRSALGKAEAIETIKAISTLCSSSENADFREAIQLAVGMERWRRQDSSPINRENEVQGRTVEQVGLNDHKTEFYLHNQLHYLLRDFDVFLLRQLKKCVFKNLPEIRETLTQFNEMHGLEISHHVLREKVNQLIINWYTEGENWVREVVAIVSSKLVNTNMSCRETAEILLTREMAVEGIHLIELIFRNCKVRMGLIRMTLAHIHKFLLDLKNFPNPEVPRAKDVDVEELKRFKKKLLADMDSELGRKGEKILDSLRQQIHQVASDQISNLATINPKIFNTFLRLI